VLDVRGEIGRLIGRDVNSVVLLKNGRIPIHPTQNTKLAYWFLSDPSDFLQVYVTEN
jgi:hypothetical protein